MLVLTRKVGQQIVVPGCRVTVTVLAVHGQQVRLGITAPPEVSVRRKEAWTQTQPPGHPAVAKAEKHSMRVLIADPNPYLLDSYREGLRHYGFEVLTASSGLECVDMLRRCAPDFLVLEPALPWGGGDGVLAMIHEEADLPLVPVMVLTCGRDRGVLYRLAPYTVEDYQTKPVGAKQLADRIRAIVQSRPAEVRRDSIAG